MCSGEQTSFINMLIIKSIVESSMVLEHGP